MTTTATATNTTTDTTARMNRRFCITDVAPRSRITERTSGQTITHVQSTGWCLLHQSMPQLRNPQYQLGCFTTQALHCKACTHSMVDVDVCVLS
jgi:hypothetical protein